MSSAAQDRLFELWREIRGLDAAGALLSWDQETYMPPRGLDGRAEALSTIAGVVHERVTSVEIRDALLACEEEAEPGSELAAQVAHARRRVDRATRVPASLARELAEASSKGLAAWQQARERSDFSAFSRQLGHLIELKRQEAAVVAPEGRPYDALLDEYEPGATEAELEPLFESLRAALAPLVQAVGESPKTVDESPALGRFPVDAQRTFCIDVAGAMGFDFEAGRLDATAHPFCQSLNPGDVRLTWRWKEDDFRVGLYGVIHEAGHGLYEQGQAGAFAGTPIGEAVSLGIHESQSRLWENHVGRSRAFWQWALPRFAERFPDHRSVSVDEIWPTLQVVRPSLIRVEADQITYNLHVAVRFEIERQIFAGELDVDDLPGRWSDLYQELLGIRPPNDAEGVLQDIHWAMGAFGYFPTYTLGTLAAAQLFEAMSTDLGDVEERMAAGELRALLDWLRDRIHRHGSRYSAGELIERSSGERLAADAFLAHARSLVTEVYAIG
jgi:carboxypeptidase Taq